uniref:CDK5 regulatory subunit-associated protein 3 n=1 Tax=Ditylenchus dipsaci TaxID=166011 RepID=A0A915DWR3_9BILA
MDSLPIDIHSNKLLEWLISRRHCNKNWQNAVNSIREKISEAIQDMPENERILNLLRGSYINYFHCKEIVEILKETEKDSKNMFGFYSSQRMKDWREIISLYEKENVYLAEAAQFLQRFIQYEIPSLKKQISKAEACTRDAERKEEDYRKQSIEGKRIYDKELAKLGIEGNNMKNELLQLAADLPAFFADNFNKIGELEDALVYYQKFRKYTRLNQKCEDSEQVLPLIQRLISRLPEKLTVYEWKYGHAPDKVEQINIKGQMDTPEADVGDEIDFGDDAEIDFGDSGAAIEEQVIVIDVLNEESQLIDGIVTKPEISTIKVARGSEGLSVLENPETLPSVVSELEELLCFLTFRKIDENSENVADIYLSGIETKPADLSIKLSAIEKWSNLIRSSPVFVEEMINELEHKRLIEHKYKRLVELMVEKQNGCAQQVLNSQELLDGIIDAAKTLQENIESDISKRYNNREVYIMGEINAVLYG